MVFSLVRRRKSAPSNTTTENVCPYAGTGAGASAPQPPRTPSTTSTTSTTDAGFVDRGEAETFVRRFHGEQPRAGDVEDRVRAVLDEIDRTGTYEHSPAELAFGARVAWRNAARCIGRLYWRSMVVRDLRHVTAADDIAEACFEHLRLAGNGGRIRPVLSVFAPDRPDRPGPRIVNDQLVRYAGHRAADGSWNGDPRGAMLTARARHLGWKRDEEPFQTLPLMVREAPDRRPEWYELPDDAVLEVPLRHPDHAWFAELGLRWYAVPAISDMTLEIGGVRYPAAPFNGWYMGTEIGARNLADTDRYDLLPVVADRLGLDRSSERTLWRDRALVELNVAVLHSYEAEGVTMADHHTESDRFLRHIAQEARLGRTTPADWSWIVPPISGAATSVFHRYYTPPDPTLRPAFLAREAP
ncbi:nitric oxide synthase oxygenase [Streptomyces sp. NPDC048659]|uniref:nitric oxide synthase oxygenase n=1 Tax=Streptomyces sp. NPDC048659 TaxID=3155489 RepID=UPI0034377C8C